MTRGVKLGGSGGPWLGLGQGSMFCWVRSGGLWWWWGSGQVVHGLEVRSVGQVVHSLGVG